MTCRQPGIIIFYISFCSFFQMLIDRFIQIGLYYTTRFKLCMIITLNQKVRSPDMKLMMVLWDLDDAIGLK